MRAGRWQLKNHLAVNARAVRGGADRRLVRRGIAKIMTETKVKGYFRGR